MARQSGALARNILPERRTARKFGGLDRSFGGCRGRRLLFRHASNSADCLYASAFRRICPLFRGGRSRNQSLFARRLARCAVGAMAQRGLRCPAYLRTEDWLGREENLL